MTNIEREFKNTVDENGEIVEGIVSSEFRNFNVKYWGLIYDWI